MSGQSDSSFDMMVKCLVIGCAGVGKTSILKRLIYKTYNPSYKATIGVDFGFYRVNLQNNGKEVCTRLMLYDIAGQERYNALVRAYYKDSYAAFVVGDITSPTFRDDVRSWKSSIDAKVTFPETSDPIPCILLANKDDLEHFYKQSDLEDFAQKYGFKAVYTTSALTGHNLEKAAYELASLVIQKVNERGAPAENEQNNGNNIIFINPEPTISTEKDKNKKQNCCKK